MSWQACRWAAAQIAGSTAAKATLMMLAESADDQGLTWIGDSTIAARAELSRRSVIDQMRLLEQRGLIRRERRIDPKTGYRLSDRVFLQLTGLSADRALGGRCQGEPVAPRKEAQVQMAQGLGANDCEPRCTSFTGTLLEPSIEQKESPPTPSRRSSPRTGEDGATYLEFEAWWAIYPLHVGKIAARKAFSRILAKGLATINELMDGVAAYARARAGQDPKFTKHPTTWLNGGCWSDDQPTADVIPFPQNDRQSPDYLRMAFEGGDQ